MRTEGHIEDMFQVLSGREKKRKIINSKTLLMLNVRS